MKKYKCIYLGSECNRGKIQVGNIYNISLDGWGYAIVNDIGDVLYRISEYSFKTMFEETIGESK